MTTAPKKPAGPRKKGGKKKPWRWRRWAILAVLAALIAFPFVEVFYVKFFPPPVTTLMIARWVEGRFSKEYKGDVEYRWVPLAKISESFVEAVWVAEDERFFKHDGIDWQEVALAQNEAERTGKPPRGASTITMQCARSVFLWQGRSWIRKGLEAGYTVLMEKTLSKKRILELYVNCIEMGDGVYGVEAAAQKYYGKSAANLSMSESAMLAALLPYPRGWNPLSPTPRLKRRHAMILRKMRHARFPKQELSNAR